MSGTERASAGAPPIEMTGVRDTEAQDRELIEVFQINEEGRMICNCGLRMSINPHPNAGMPGFYLEAGASYVCIPCTVKSRHAWSSRALAAEAELNEIKNGGPNEPPIVFD